MAGITRFLQQIRDHGDEGVVVDSHIVQRGERVITSDGQILERTHDSLIDDGIVVSHIKIQFPDHTFYSVYDTGSDVGIERFNNTLPAVGDRVRLVQLDEYTGNIELVA